MGTMWPIWECLSLKPEQLVALIQYQWDHFGLKLELMTDFFREIESWQEIDRLMRKPTKGKLLRE